MAHTARAEMSEPSSVVQYFMRNAPASSSALESASASASASAAPPKTPQRFKISGQSSRATEHPATNKSGASSSRFNDALLGYLLNANPVGY